MILSVPRWRMQFLLLALESSSDEGAALCNVRQQDRTLVNVTSIGILRHGLKRPLSDNEAPPVPLHRQA